MPLTNSLDIDSDVVVEGGPSAQDAPQSERFSVKAGMRYWIDVDYSRPERARQLLAAEEVVDTDDQGTCDILMAAPEITYVGNTPP